MFNTILHVCNSLFHLRYNTLKEYDDNVMSSCKIGVRLMVFEHYIKKNRNEFLNKEEIFNIS